MYEGGGYSGGYACPYEQRAVYQQPVCPLQERQVVYEQPIIEEVNPPRQYIGCEERIRPPCEPEPVLAPPPPPPQAAVVIPPPPLPTFCGGCGVAFEADERVCTKCKRCRGCGRIHAPGSVLRH
jgi:hypothetical protein